MTVNAITRVALRLERALIAAQDAAAILNKAAAQRHFGLHMEIAQCTDSLRGAAKHAREIAGGGA